MRLPLVMAFILAVSTASAAPPQHAAFITMSGPGISINAVDNVISAAARSGGHIHLVFPVHSQPGRILSSVCIIGTILPGQEAGIIGLPYVNSLIRGQADPATLELLGEEAVYAGGAWNFLLAGGGDEPPPPGLEPCPNDALGPLENGELMGKDSKVRLTPEELKAKKDISITALAAPGQYQTSEFMIGRVALGLVLPESNGNGENWGSVDTNAQPATVPPTVIQDRRQEVLNRVSAACLWWDNTGGNAANLTFVIDQRFNIPITQEPITVSTAGSGEGAWISEALTNMGHTGGTAFQQAYDYNNSIRSANNADWAFSVFVADSFNDNDGMFPNNTSAFAYMFGPYMVMTYDNGTNGPGGAWGILRMHLVTSHEIGHIFGAPDEYNGAPTNTTGSYGYLNVLNGNSFASVGLNQVPCLMISNTQQLCAFTRGHVGWRDTDADGIFDPVDCPLSFPSAGLNYFVPPFWGKSWLQGQGVVQSTPWVSPTRTSVTINKARASYSVDGGAPSPATPSDGAFDSDDEAFTFTTASYSDGQHAVGLTAQDDYGNTATLAPALQVTIDTSPPPGPTGALITPSPYLANPTQCTVNWTQGGTDPESGLYGHRVFLHRDGIIAPIAWADVVIPAQSYTFTGLNLPHGLKFFGIVQAINQAGVRGSGSVTSDVWVDTTPPGAPATMSDSGAGTSQFNQLSFSWTAATEDVSGISDYLLSIRNDLNNWIVSNQSTGNVTNYTATGLSLVPGRKYFGSVVPVNGAGASGSSSPESDGIVAATTYASISAAKLNASMGSAAFIPGVYVTCSGADQPGIIYVIQSSGTCGIRTDETTNITRGSGVDVAGTLQLNVQNELCLQNSEVYVRPSPPTFASPSFGMSGITLGGSAYGLQPAFIGGSGLNTAAIPVQIWGTVTYASTGPPYYFVVDDGSGLTDQSGIRGIGVRCGSITPPSQGSFRTVSGICSYESGYPVILLRQSGDWW